MQVHIHREDAKTPEQYDGLIDMENIIHLKSSGLQGDSLTQILFQHIYLEAFEVCEYFVKT